MWTTLGLAFALMLVFEGLMPLLSPTKWRDLFRRVSTLADGQIRFYGLVSVMCGLLLIAALA